MIGEPVTAKVVRSDDAEVHVLASPGVGLFGEPPSPGTRLTPGDTLGTLRILSALHEIVVPTGGGGIVSRVLVRGRRVPVEYGQELLAMTLSVDPSDAVFDPEEALKAQDAEVPEGMLAVRSPTDGIFYRRPTPTEPAYVDEGTEVARGRVLGLVEVMKAFNPITWGTDPEAPEHATIRKILVEDSTEVHHDQLLFLVEPGA